jgi:hypothetical protein
MAHKTILLRFDLCLTLVFSLNCGVLSGEAVEEVGSRIRGAIFDE